MWYQFSTILIIFGKWLSWWSLPLKFIGATLIHYLLFLLIKSISWSIEAGRIREAWAIICKLSTLAHLNVTFSCHGVFQVDFDPVRWLDRALIRICSKFGDYQKETPSSFSLSPRLSIFPQFIFNLRRSQFVQVDCSRFFINQCFEDDKYTSLDTNYLFLLQVFNNSPDETAYFRMMLDRENVANAVVMIQPSLVSYSFQSGPEPVLLDATAIASDKILLLDSYFTVVIFHGVTIAQWRNACYQDQEGHEVTCQCFTALWC